MERSNSVGALPALTTVASLNCSVAIMFAFNLQFAHKLLNSHAIMFRNVFQDATALWELSGRISLKPQK